MTTFAYPRKPLSELRQEMMQAAGWWTSDATPQNWSDVFIPEGHYKALNPQNMIVEGMRGAGKSFWTHVLGNPVLRTNLTKASSDIFLQEELKRVTDCKTVLWDGSNPAPDPSATEVPRLPSSGEVGRWLKANNFDAKAFWSLIVLSRFPIDPALGLPVINDPYEPWGARMEWAQKHPTRLANALFALEDEFRQQGGLTLVVIDGLDRVSPQFLDTQRLMTGLFQLLLDFRHAKGLKFKLFVREDILSQCPPTVSDASKLLNERVSLDWTLQDLFGHVFHFLAQRSEPFRRYYSYITKDSWSQSNNRYQTQNLLVASEQEKCWIAMVGSSMGSHDKAGHVYSWIAKHLGDGKRRTSPRTFFTAVKTAFEEATSQYPEHEKLLHHEAIREGVRKASHYRVQELNDEYAWVSKVLAAFKNDNRTMPLEWTAAKKLLSQGSPSVMQEIEPLISGSHSSLFIPWNTQDHMETQMTALRETLLGIGVLQIRRHKGVEKIDLPDLYRLAFGIGRFGGIAAKSKN